MPPVTQGLFSQSTHLLDIRTFVRVGGLAVKMRFHNVVWLFLLPDVCNGHSSGAAKAYNFLIFLVSFFTDVKAIIIPLLEYVSQYHLENRGGMETDLKCPDEITTMQTFLLLFSKRP